MNRSTITSMKEMLDVIVIGAGYSGLSCAMHLKEQGVSFLLLESSDRVGGRTLDQVVEDNCRIELGGEYITPEQKLVTQMVSKLGLKTYPAWGEGDHFLLYEGKKALYQSTPAECLGKLLNDIHVQTEIEQALCLLDAMFKEVPTNSPWESPQATLWDGMTFQSWLNEHLKTEAAKQFFRFMTNQGFSTEPELISLLQMLWFFKTSHGLPGWALGGKQANRVDGGTQLVALKMAETFSDRIRYSERVTQIVQEELEAKVYTETNLYRAKAVVICIPPQLIPSVHYSPPLPSDLHRSFASFQTGNSMKVQAVYKKPFWREMGLSGNGISFNGIPTFTYDNSGPKGTPGVLLGFVTATNATKWNRVSQEERKYSVLHTWASIFGPKALDPIEYVEYDFLKDPHIRGGHGCHFPPGVWKELGPALGKDKMPHFKRLIWASSDLAKDWNGYLEGALYAGKQAATELRID